VPSMISCKAGKIIGDILVPGDKSISHRALMFGAVSIGETKIEGLLEGEDVLATAQALRQLGVTIKKSVTGQWIIQGVGVGGLSQAEDIIDMGNSGTAVRLLCGLLASYPLRTVFTGDASLRSRPMKRVIDPLEKMGAIFNASEGGKLPFTLTGAKLPLPITYELPVASAQIKSAVLLAGLNTAGKTTVIEPTPSRDHSERMLAHFGADINVEIMASGERCITINGEAELIGQQVTVPGDISSAAFPIVAALITPNSALTIKNVGINPLRSGLIETLIEMGADIELQNRHDVAGEPVADIVVKSSMLHGIQVPAKRAPSMIDEYPVLAVAAASAKGVTYMPGLAELRVKESDRLAVMSKGLKDCGVTVDEGKDSLTVTGHDQPLKGGAMIATRLDHRIAMSFLVLGMVTETPITVDDGSPIETSFPGFMDMMNGLGADIKNLKS